MGPLGTVLALRASYGRETLLFSSPWMTVSDARFSVMRLPTTPTLGLGIAGLLACVPFFASAQILIVGDDFESSGSTVSSSVWPGSTGSRVEGVETFFGTNNRYLHISGAGVKVMSANWSSELAGKGSTFAFDYYEPAGVTNYMVAGYAAGTSDINTAGAFARISLGGGTVRFNSTDGTVQTNSGTVIYAPDRRLTFSLVLNDTETNQPLNGTPLQARTLEVWFYDWVTQQTNYALTISVAASTRAPVAVAFRTWSTETGMQAYIDNAKLLDAAVVVVPGFIPAEPPEVPIVPVRRLAHPGVFNSQEDLDRLKYRINQQPGATAVAGWNQMIASSYASLSYQHVPYSNVVVMASGTTPSESQFRQDGHAARAAALRWVITGDTRYRDKARTILDDWANTFVTMSPASGTSTAQIELEAAWAAPIWVSAADIIRYYDDGAAGWSSAAITKFDSMLNYLHTQAVKAATRDNNWGASAALTMIAVGEYQNDRARFDAGVQTWRDRLAGVNAVVSNNGFINEVCRDTVHPQYTLQVMMQGAEVAWKNGVDLFGATISGGTSPQFAINLENFGQLFLGLIEPPCSASFLTNYDYLDEQSHSGAYDIACNHYVNRAGSTALPTYTNMVVSHWRPGGWDEHFCSWSTFTHGDLSAGIPVLTGFALWNTASNAAAGTVADGDTINLRALGSTQFTIAAQTAGTVSSVQFQTNGVRCGAASTNAPFTLGPMLQPGNYFLRAVPAQHFGGGDLPGDALMSFVRVMDLSTNWQLREIGTPSMPGWVAESGANLVLAAAGTNVAGVRDQFGLVSAEIAGDLQLTAFIVGVQAMTGVSQGGLMVRDGTSPGARCLFLSLRTGATNNVVFQCRGVDQGTITNVATAPMADACWLRLLRLGNLFTAYYSLDGKAWTALGAAVATLSQPVRAGLAVASGAADAVARAEFQEVLIEPLSASYAEWQNWMFARRGQTNAVLAGAEEDPDGDGRSNQWEYWLGSDPLSPDASPAVSVAGMGDGPCIRLRFVERKNAAGVGRVFLYSPDLVNWSTAAPNSVTPVEDRGSIVVNEVIFPVSAAAAFYRAAYAP